MEIEQITSENIIRVQQIARETWADTYGEILSPEQLQFMWEWMYNLETLRQQVEGEHLYYILKNEGVDLGFIGVQPHYPNFEETKLHKIYILPTAQGKGVGRILIDQALNVAKEFQSSRLMLNVNRFNKAKDFYLRLGFEIIKEEDIDIGHGYLMEDYVMQKIV